MDYFNADGFPADLCLNGTRCAAQLAFHLGWAEGTGARCATGAGAVSARRLDDSRTAVELPAPGRAAAARDGRGRRRGLHRLAHRSWACPTSCSSGRTSWRRRRSASWAGRSATIPPSARRGPTSTSSAFPHGTGWRSGPSSAASRTRPSPAAPASWPAPPWASPWAASVLPLRVATQGGFELLVDGDPAKRRLVARRRRPRGRRGRDPARGRRRPAPPAWAGSPPLLRSCEIRYP